MDYDTASVCENGHKITAALRFGGDSPHCSGCGAKAVTACGSCGTYIRGFAKGTMSLHWERPSYCHACGEPHPWTAKKIAAARELAEAIDELTDHERDQLAELLPHIVQETPRTDPASFKAGTIIGRLKGPGRKVLYDFIVGMAVDGAKKILAG